MHGSASTHVETGPAKESFQCQMEWEREVEVPDLHDHQGHPARTLGRPISVRLCKEKSMKIAADPLKAEFNRNSEMRDLMLKYTQALIAQVSQNAACNRLHDMDERCARWLLEVRDRIESDRFPLTQEFIAEMLRVRRAGVT